MRQVCSVNKRKPTGSLALKISLFDPEPVSGMYGAYEVVPGARPLTSLGRSLPCSVTERAEGGEGAGGRVTAALVAVGQWSYNTAALAEADRGPDRTGSGDDGQTPARLLDRHLQRRP